MSRPHAGGGLLGILGREVWTQVSCLVCMHSIGVVSVWWWWWWTNTYGVYFDLYTISVLVHREVGSRREASRSRRTPFISFARRRVRPQIDASTTNARARTHAIGGVSSLVVSRGSPWRRIAAGNRSRCSDDDRAIASRARRNTMATRARTRRAARRGRERGRAMASEGANAMMRTRARRRGTRVRARCRRREGRARRAAGAGRSRARRWRRRRRCAWGRWRR